jgi:hypothetical protein
MSRKQQATAPEASAPESKPTKRQRAKYDPKLCAKMEKEAAIGACER